MLSIGEWFSIRFLSVQLLFRCLGMFLVLPVTLYRMKLQCSESPVESEEVRILPTSANVLYPPRMEIKPET